jgi:prephenate dehydrogenase
VHFSHVALIGVGILGGSLGLALRERRPTVRITGYVRRPETVLLCQQRDVAHHVSTDLAAAVRDADLIVLCTPIGQFTTLTEAVLPYLRPNAIITDIGSTKASVVHSLEPLCLQSNARFVGSHPMAGSEQTGVASARSNLFVDARCVVTPTLNTSQSALESVLELWKSVGAVPLIMDALEHDAVVSRSSHLPHVVAALLARHVLDPSHPSPQRILCASGFRDTTRIASGSPEMWRDIALSNRDALLTTLTSWSQDLASFIHALENNDAKTLESLFRQAKERRDAWNDSQGRSSNP